MVGYAHRGSRGRRDGWLLRWVTGSSRARRHLHRPRSSPGGVARAGTHGGVKELAGTFTVPVQATDDPRDVGTADLILFCVKTYDTEVAAQSIRPLIRPETMIMSLQNGIGNEERIAQAAGHDSGIGAVAYVVSAIKAPGVVAQSAGPGKIVFGELGGGTSQRTERLHEVLQKAGIAVELHHAVGVVFWQKFL